MSTSYLETRHHELRKTRLTMIDGNLAGNLRAVQAGSSARAWRDGYWGFASAPRADDATRERVQREACANAAAMAGFGSRRAPALPGSCPWWFVVAKCSVAWQFAQTASGPLAASGPSRTSGPVSPPRGRRTSTAGACASASRTRSRCATDRSIQREGPPATW